MVIADSRLLKGQDAVAACRRAVAGGATLVQVRWKEAPAAMVVEVTRALVAALPVGVIVNDRVDVALAAGARGAHLGQDDLPVDAIRPHVPPGFLLGVSVGSAAEAQRAHPWPADYWSVGPCFATATKPDAGSALGRGGWAALARLAPAAIPVVAIGGISAANAASVMAAGAAGVAVAAAVFDTSDPQAATRALRAALAAPPS